MCTAAFVNLNAYCSISPSNLVFALHDYYSKVYNPSLEATEVSLQAIVYHTLVFTTTKRLHKTTPNTNKLAQVKKNTKNLNHRTSSPV